MGLSLGDNPRAQRFGAEYPERSEGMKRRTEIWELTKAINKFLS